MDFDFFTSMSHFGFIFSKLGQDCQLCVITLALASDLGCLHLEPRSIEEIEHSKHESLSCWFIYLKALMASENLVFA